MSETPTGPPNEGSGGAPGGNQARTPTGSQEFGRLGDRYEVGGLLGRGGMADVRVGRDLRLGRQVAIKRLRTDLASDPTFLARFRREAQSAAALNHPSIVAVYDTGEGPGADGQTAPYIVMEYVDGQTLRDIVRDGRKILPQRSLEITADILSALNYSHHAGIVHRDIKPGNVMLTPSGQVKVMDFGIARAIADSSSAMTQTAAVVGTAQYLSPEQARGEVVDARSDIYSTGCLLYELLTGRPPFVGDSPVSVAYQHVREVADPPSTLNPDVTPAMDQIVAKALAKRTEDRYQSAADMRADIERAMSGQDVTAATAAVPAYAEGGTMVGTAAMPAAPPPTAQVPPTAHRDEERRRRRRWPWVLTALVVIVLIAVAAWGVPRLIDASNTPPPANVPNVVGKSQDAAQRLIDQSDLKVGDVTKRSDADVEEGSVVAQDPKADAEAQKGDPVDLVVSTGPKTVGVPYVVGKSYKDAKTELEDNGLKAEKEFRNSDSPKNEVLSSNPVYNTQVKPGSKVTLIVSQGKVEVPDVVGEKQKDAEAALDDAGFDVKIVKDPGSDKKAGTVTDQDPGGGDKATPGSTVYLTVSDKPKPTTPPPSPTTTPPPSPTTTPPTSPSIPPTPDDFGQ
ncbi:MAG: Stk1 family PASTA domain-containing Ser/Thr kinase [Nocardioidaceae bacterium]